MSEQGNSIAYSRRDDERQIIATLLAEADATLKPGERFELRKDLNGDPLQMLGMAWYRHPDMDAEPDWGSAARPGLVGQYVAGEQRGE